jgi:hypothetical protein
MFGLNQNNPNTNPNNPNNVDPNLPDGTLSAGGALPAFTDGDANARDVNTPAFFTALRVNALACVALVTAHELFRRWFPSVYRGRRRTAPAGSRPHPPGRHPSSSASSSPAPLVPGDRHPRRPLSWVPGVVRAPWSAVRAAGGLDSYMFLRYVRLCARITGTSALWGLLLLGPVYAAGDGGARGWYYLSMANLSQGSQRLWVPTAFLWLQTLYGECAGRGGVARRPCGCRVRAPTARRRSRRLLRPLPLPPQ